jgi:acylglycerol lipase
VKNDASPAERSPKPPPRSSRASNARSPGGQDFSAAEVPFSLTEVPDGSGGRYLARENGARLFIRAVSPAGPSRGVVVVTHGLGEHSGRYGHVAEALAARGLGVVLWDLRGHGRSSGDRGDAEAYEDLIDDLETVCAAFREEGKPLFLFAHSMGGQVALRFIQERGPACAGAIIASPWLRLAFDPPWWKIALARLAVRVWPRLPQKTGASWERLSRDFEHLASFPDLHLAHHVITARLYFAVREAGEAALADAGKLRLPLFLAHGDDDPITCHQATGEFFQRAGSEDKTLRSLRGARHETHNDLDRAIILKEVGDWVEARLPRT